MNAARTTTREGGTHAYTDQARVGESEHLRGDGLHRRAGRHLVAVGLTLLFLIVLAYLGMYLNPAGIWLTDTFGGGL